MQIEEFLDGSGELTINALGLDGAKSEALKTVHAPEANGLIDVIIPLDAISQEIDSELTVYGIDSWEVGSGVPANACLIDIRTECRSYDVEAGVAGVLHSILVKRGDIVKRGYVVARVKKD